MAYTVGGLKPAPTGIAGGENFACGWLVCAGVAADQGEVEEVADADGERDDGEGGGDPDFGVVLDLGDEAEGSDDAEGAGAEKNCGAARTGGFGKVGNHGDFYAAGHGGEALLGAEFADVIVGVHGGYGDAEVRMTATRPMNSPVMVRSFAFVRRRDVCFQGVGWTLLDRDTGWVGKSSGN